MPLRRYLIALGAAAAFASSPIHAASENAWPNRPVHMVVPFAAGGPTDTYARIVAERLSTIWGQQVVIDNKGGAGSNIGNAFVAHSGPDGYTLLFGCPLYPHVRTFVARVHLRAAHRARSPW